MITLDNVSKHYGSTDILNSVSVALHDNERTGLVGVNGSGKTTLLRMLSGQEEPDRGAIQKSSALTIGYLPQEVEVLGDKTAIEIVLEPFAHLLDFEEKLGKLADNSTAALQKIDDLHNELEFHDVYSLEARAKSILAGLGVPKDKWEEPVRLLSGGFRMRTVLGRLLLSSPDFLLLDEPTNHLDMDSLVWLEDFLKRYRGGMLIVSHDRDFLNRMCGFIAEIRVGSISLYKGNYNEYLRLREQAVALAESRTRHLQDQITQKERFVERFKAKNTKATQAQARMRKIDKLKEQLPEISVATKSIDFVFPQAPPSGSHPFKIRDLAMHYGSLPVFENVSFEVSRGDKIAILGPNGSGKSTMLKLMAGMLAPTRGVVTPGHNVIVRYFGQHQLEQLDPEKSCIETVSAVSVNTEKTFVRSLLGAFLFSGDSVDKKVKVLSGGEKSRLVLATILANPGNVLLLDEPTNHLDVNSIETLAGALAGFTGTVIVVSHDDYFVSKIATRILEMRPGLIRDFPGSLADYRSYVEQGLWGNVPAFAGIDKNETADDLKEQRIRERDQRKKLQRAIEKIERDIAAHETELGRLQLLLDDTANASDHVLLSDTAGLIRTEQAALALFLADWERLHGEFEALGKE